MSKLERLLNELIELVREYQHLSQFSDLATRDSAGVKVEAKRQEILNYVANGLEAE